VTTAMVRTRLLGIDQFARATGLHPELVRRLVALGLLEAWPAADGELCFPPSQLAAAARLRRLRAGFALNYAALGVVVDLLDRIAELEAALRANPRALTGRETSSTSPGG
jgi:chaperone modulatory protein CbpM